MLDSDLHAWFNSALFSNRITTPMQFMTYSFWMLACWQLVARHSAAKLPMPQTPHFRWPPVFAVANDSSHADDYHLIEGLWLVTTQAKEIQSIIKLTIEHGSDCKKAILHGEIYRTFKLKGKTLPVICEHGGKAYQGKPLRGLRIIHHLRPESSDWDTRWLRGKIFDPDYNRCYSAEARLVNSNTLKLTGSLLGIKRSVTWQRLPVGSAQLKQLEQRAEQEYQTHVVISNHRR